MDDAKKSVKAMNGHTLDGRELKVDLAQERGSGESVCFMCTLLQRRTLFILCPIPEYRLLSPRSGKLEKNVSGGF